MDPFDEFEFKPLTEGIGFHKKTSSLRESTQKTALVEEELNRALPEPPPESLMDQASTSKAKQLNVYDDLLKSLERPTIRDMAAKARSAFPLEMTEPLPRTSKTPASAAGASIDPAPIKTPSAYPPPAPKQERTPVSGSLSDISFIEKASKDAGVRRGAADSPMGGLQKAPISLRSAILDFLFITALSLVFMVSLLAITGASLTTVISNSQVDSTTQFSMLLLFVAVMQMYVVVARSFFGRTLGEWTFEYQMGTEAQQKSPFYPMRVALRSLVITATGIVVLPVLSFIVRRDVAAYLTGLQLYRQRNS